jgi:hypothetical protein
MIIVRNERLVNRNNRIGMYSGIISIIILGAGMYVSFQYPDLIGLSIIALASGFTLSQIGIYYSNRFGRSPRPDETLDSALKGLDNQYALYHYQSPVTHLLVGPAGIWILIPFSQKGQITYNERRKRWKKSGGSALRSFFGQESIGTPEREVKNSTTRLEKALSRIPEFKVPEIRSALVFSDEEAEVVAENAPIATLHARQLKKLIRKEAKGDQALPMASVKTIQDFLGLESIY